MTERLSPTVGNLATLLAGIGMFVGSIAPWVSISVFAFSHDISGTSTDGKFTLAVGVALILASVIAMSPVTWAGWLIVGLGIAGGGLALYDLIDLSRISAGASVGWGLILVVASGAVAIVGGISEIAEL